MSDLPKGWVECQLNELLITLESGSRPKGGVKGIVEGVPSIGAEHLTYYGTVNFTSIRYVPSSFAKNMRRGHIKIGDVLVVKDGATTGKVAIVRSDFPYTEAVVNEHVFICRPETEIDSCYLAYYLMSHEGQKRILDNFQGSAQGGINTSFVNNTIIPISPLVEQHRIVEKLEQLLARVDACRAQIDKVPTILKRFRQSVLAAACSGRLTEDWREDDIPWEEVQLSEIITELRNGIPTKPNQSLPGIPILRINSVRSGKVDINEIRFLPNAENLVEKYSLVDGDVLFTRYNGTQDLVGVCGVVRSLDKKTLLYPDKLMRIRVKPEKVIPEYLEIYYSDASTRDKVISVTKSSAGQIGISGESLKSTIVSLPSIIEQQEIVRRVNALFTFADQVEARYKQAKTHVDRLTQSILAKAFRGELVPQDPNDEPAEVLLERIKAEKKVITAGKKRK